MDPIWDLSYKQKDQAVYGLHQNGPLYHSKKKKKKRSTILNVHQVNHGDWKCLADWPLKDIKKEVWTWPPLDIDDKLMSYHLLCQAQSK